MCGRCACTRDREAIQRACAFRRKDRSSVVKPAWISVNTQTYFPSYNISPQTNTPVIISGEHEHVQTYCRRGDAGLLLHESNERVIQVMKWGLVPSWHKGEDARSFPTLLNNCRYDGMFEKPSFRNAISKRQRCVVLADGFYEWQREKAKDKKAFYIYFSERGCTEMTSELLENDCMAQSDGVTSTCGRLLTMAGYFDIWKPSLHKEENISYTYTIITVDATEDFCSIHHRMPAILETEEAISQWLDPKIPTPQAAKLLDPNGSNALTWHPVSSLVNNVKNKSPECIVKVDHSIASTNGSQSLLKWFTKSPKKHSSSEEKDAEATGGPSSKRLKSEN